MDDSVFTEHVVLCVYCLFYTKLPFSNDFDVLCENTLSTVL